MQTKAYLLLFSVFMLAACQPQVIEVTRVVIEPQQVEVTRVVTETVTEEVEVTRVVTEIEEVEVTRVVEVVVTATPEPVTPEPVTPESGSSEPLLPESTEDSLLGDDPEALLSLINETNWEAYATNVPFAGGASFSLLQELVEVLPSTPFDLENPPSDADEFDSEKVTTFALPESGTVFQLVPINQENFDLDERLRNLDDWESEYLVVGAILTYQDLEEYGLFAETATAVLVNQSGSFLFVNNIGDNTLEGEYRLRELLTPAARPYNFLTTQEMCFSQTERQVCLNLPTPQIVGGAEVAEENIAVISGAVDALIESGVLPENNINVEAALSSVEGNSEVVGACQNIFEESLSGASECLPTLVIAPGEPYAAVQNEYVLEALLGAAVMEVRLPIGPVIDEALEVVELPEGSYRFDILTTDSELIVGRLTNVEGISYYINLEPGPGRGVLVEGEEALPAVDILLEAVSVPYCSNFGEGVVCNSLFVAEGQWTSVCIADCGNLD